MLSFSSHFPPSVWWWKKKNGGGANNNDPMEKIIEGMLPTLTRQIRSVRHYTPEEGGILPPNKTILSFFFYTNRYWSLCVRKLHYPKNRIWGETGVTSNRFKYPVKKKSSSIRPNCKKKVNISANIESWSNIISSKFIIPESEQAWCNRKNQSHGKTKWRLRFVEVIPFRSKKSLTTSLVPLFRD